MFPHLSVRSNLTYGMQFVPRSDQYVTFDQVVELLGIESLFDRRSAKLSGREKQRVAIGRALLCSPALFLMDEPLTSLGDIRKSEVLPFILRLCHEFSTPVLYVSHSLDEISRLADQMVVMDHGCVAASGRLEDLAAFRLPHREGSGCCTD